MPRPTFELVLVSQQENFHITGFDWKASFKNLCRACIFYTGDACIRDSASFPCDEKEDLMAIGASAAFALKHKITGKLYFRTNLAEIMQGDPVTEPM